LIDLSGIIAKAAATPKLCGSSMPVMQSADLWDSDGLALDEDLISRGAGEFRFNN
jgi:hypothetical protein